MSYTATVTSKMQLTIPITIARKTGVRTGEKVHVSEINGRIILTPMKRLVEELAGSLIMPEKWKDKDIDSIIRDSKQEYFQNKKI